MWKLQALLFSFLIPKEFSIFIGSLSLSPYKLLLVILTPWVLIKLFTRRKFKWLPLDTVALIVCCWPAIALMFNTGISRAIESGGILFLETFVPFFMARLMVYKHEHLVMVSKTLLIVASVMAITALPEAITGKPFLHNIASAVTGNPFSYTPENRLGIWRSYGPTDHPIILGSICAAALPLGFALFRHASIFVAMTGISFFGVIASASSAPLLSIVAQFLLYIWSKLTRGNRNKWWLLIILIGLLYILIDLSSNRDPFRVMFSYLLFNEHNGYVRYNMWVNSFFLVGQSIQSALVGYGFSTEMMSLLDNMFWTRLMSSSVDSYWMVILLRYGVPMLVFSVLMVIMVFRVNVKTYRRHKRSKERALIQAWLITAISLSLVACTVHFWGSMASLFFVVLGATAMGKVKKHGKQVGSTTKSDIRIQIATGTQTKRLGIRR